MIKLYMIRTLLRQIFHVYPKSSWGYLQMLIKARRYISGFNLSPVVGFHLPRVFVSPSTWWWFCMWGGVKRSDIYQGFDFDIGFRVTGCMLGCTLTIEITE